MRTFVTGSDSTNSTDSTNSISANSTDSTDSTDSVPCMYAPCVYPLYTLIVLCMDRRFTCYVPSIYPLCTLYVPSIYLALRLTCGRISISHFQSASAPVLAGSSSTSSPSGRLVIHIAARVGGEFIDIERILQVG